MHHGPTFDRNRRDRQRAEVRLDPAKYALARAHDNARKLKNRVERKHAAGQVHCPRRAEPWSEEERDTLLPNSGLDGCNEISDGEPGREERLPNARAHGLAQLPTLHPLAPVEGR